MSEENLAALLGFEKTQSEPARPVPAPEVETTLPLIGASEVSRAGTPILERPGPVETTRPLIATSGESTESRSPTAVWALCGLVVLAAGLSAFLLRDRWWPLLRPGATAPAPSFPLQLGVESQGNGVINIRWNPQSGPVVQAREGRLMITERDQQPQIVPLAADQLKIGHLYFQSSAERIEFRLEVVDRSGISTNESVLALSSGLNTSPADAPAQAGQTPAPKAAAAPGVAANADTPQVAKAVEAPPPSRPIRTFTLPPPPTLPSAEEGRVVLPDSPAVPLGGSAVAADEGLLPTVNGLSSSRLPVARVKEVPRQIKVGGNVQAANLIKKVAPEYSPMAKVARVQGAVRFSATIAKDGTIHSLQVLSGNPLLIPSATDAVKQWIYRPTLLNGDPVEVVTQIEVNFTLGQ